MSLQLSFSKENLFIVKQIRFRKSPIREDDSKEFEFPEIQI